MLNLPVRIPLSIPVATITVLALVVSILMTTRCATPCPQIPQRRMTLITLRPIVAMIAGIYPEIRGIMIHRVRRKHARAVTHGAVVRELL